MPCRKGCLLSSSANVLVCKGSSRLHCSGRQIYSFCDAVTLELICLHSLQSTLRMFTNELSGRSPRCQSPQRHRCHHTPSPSKSCHSKRKPTVLKHFANASCLTLAACKSPNALACSQSSILEHQITLVTFTIACFICGAGSPCFFNPSLSSCLLFSSFLTSYSSTGYIHIFS